MPPATAAPPRAGASPPGSAVAPHHLGFLPPLAGTPLSSPSGKPRQCHGSQPVPDTEDDPRTPGSAEFFLREPPESPDDNTDLPHTGITCEQQLQWRAQFYVYLDLKMKKPPAEHTMVHAFGGPVESQKHAWREIWCAAVDRWESKKSLVPGYDTPPSSGSCTSEQGSKSTTVGKSTISEQGEACEKETQGLVIGSASIHADILEQKNDDDDHIAINCAEQADQLLSDDSSNFKKNALCGGQTFLESHFSSPKNIPRKNITDIQESCHSLNKSAPNSRREIQESSSSRTGSCTSEQGSKDTTVENSSISEQGEAGEKEAQGLVVGSVSIHPPKNTTKHTEMLEQKNGDEDHVAINCAEQVDQLISDDGSNLKNNAICGGQTILESHCSSPKNNPGKTITDIQESCQTRNKSGANSPHDLQESSGSLIGSCIAEQNISVAKTFILEQHISDDGEEASQGPYFGCDRNHLGESTINKVDQVISDGVNNLEYSTVYDGKQSLLDSCFKCGEHGQLLKCRSCSIAAHVSCFGPFGSSVRIDDGHFCCPPCFFYKANEAHKKAVKALSEASNHLSAFLLIKPFGKQHREQLSRKDEGPGHEKTNDASDACPERNYDPRRPARTRSPRTPKNRLAPRRRTFVTTARRKPIDWTEEEEAALREAVARFAPKGKGKISWVQIWEHSMDSFHPARLPKDLGQKWSRMKKRSKASEGCGAFKI